MVVEKPNIYKLKAELIKSFISMLLVGKMRYIISCKSSLIGIIEANIIFFKFKIGY